MFRFVRTRLCCFMLSLLAALSLAGHAYAEDDPLRHGHALLIGISEYDDKTWPILEDMPLQLEKLEQGLAAHFDDVKIENDLTEVQLEARIKDFLSQYENDSQSRLLIYYAGHGYTEPVKEYSERRGFVTGKDTPAPDMTPAGYDRARAKALSMRSIRELLELSHAHSVIVIFDSCFAGTIFTDRALDELGPLPSDRVIQLATNPARDIITAGNSFQKVPGHSPIPDLLVAAVNGGADRFGWGVVTANEIQSYLLEHLRNVNLTPLSGRLDRPAFANGRFLFRVPGANPSPVRDEDAVNRLQSAVGKGDAEAQFNLGLSKMRGDAALQPDPREGIRLIKLAAEQGHTDAQATLGFAYTRGDGGLPIDKREAVKLFRLAAEKGNTYAQTSLGTAYWWGDGGLPVDMRAAVKWYKQAAEKQNVDAQVNLGLAYARGGGVARDAREAVRLFTLAANQENPQGQVALGVAYSLGDGGLPRDLIKAVELFRRAADKGVPEAQARLGLAYSRGDGGLPRDFGEAVRLFRLAADQGDPLGQAELGWAYTAGFGIVPIDLREAVRLFKLSASRGEPEGQFYLGVAQLRGDGGLRSDPNEANRLFRLAASAGHLGAMDALRGVFH